MTANVEEKPKKDEAPKAEMPKAEKAVIDGKNAVMGRLASGIAKRLLSGQEITVINVEKILITGSTDVHKKFYWARRDRGTPQHGPFYPNAPDAMFRRTVKGMLPKNKARGKDALSRLKLILGDGGLKGESVARPIKSSFTRLETISKEIGWKGL